jgi:hypothetical protein
LKLKLKRNKEYNRGKRKNWNFFSLLIINNSPSQRLQIKETQNKKKNKKRTWKRFPRKNYKKKNQLNQSTEE